MTEIVHFCTEAQLGDSCYEWVRRFGECHAKEKQYEDDDVDHSVWVAPSPCDPETTLCLTLEECKEACNTEVDAHGRQCVAIEWHSEIVLYKYGYCNLAWACDEVAYHWSRNWVYRRYILRKCQCFRKNRLKTSSKNSIRFLVVSTVEDVGRILLPIPTLDTLIMSKFTRLHNSVESIFIVPLYSVFLIYFVYFLYHHRLDDVDRDQPEIGGFDAMNELTSNVFVVSGKDLIILALLLLNICSVIVLVCRCTKNKVRTGKKVIYKPVGINSENERLNV